MDCQLNHIELFAGCGGLNLGLKAAGFDLLLANELSPMAAETFAYNFLGEDLKTISEAADGISKKVRWISSDFPDDKLADRLKENPLKQRNERSYTDLPHDFRELRGKLLVGSVVELNNWLDLHPVAAEQLRDGLGDGGVDLISGGPPCQSFSMAGMRDFNNSRNKLPGVFAEFAGKVRPKFVLLENVSGILRPFTVDEAEQKVHAWIEVAKAFALQGYVPLCLHVNAKFVGVAQNRPRFVMIAVRHECKFGYDDVFTAIRPSLDSDEPGLFEQSQLFYEKVRANSPVSDRDLPCFDINDYRNAEFFAAGRLLSPLLSHKKGQFCSVADAIDDLKYPEQIERTAYGTMLSNIFRKKLALACEHPSLQNIAVPKNTAKTQRRFRIYQVLQEIGVPSVQKEIQAFLNGRLDTLQASTVSALLQHEFLMCNAQMEIFRGRTKNEKEKKLVNFLLEHRTRKHSQKALVPTSPAPATLSIPDDACHYGPLRTLSIREMARIQSFPDEFVFCSKTTTGGQMRKFQVPQYTQVGNAVPPLLGLALGEVVNKLHQYYLNVSVPRSNRRPEERMVA